MKLVKALIVVLMFGFVSCGPSIRITDTWKSPGIDSIQSDNFIVMARTDDMVSRQRFEDEMVNQMVLSGMKAKASYIAYPDIKVNKKSSDAETEKLIKVLKKDGYEGVVLTVLKDVKTDVITQDTGASYYPTYYGGFGAYYGRFYSPYGMGGTYIPSSSRTYTSDTYKVETVVYDLTKAIGKQLVAVVSVDVTDPQSAAQVAEPYAIKVVQEFKEQQ